VELLAVEQPGLAVEQPAAKSHFAEVPEGGAQVLALAWEGPVPSGERRLALAQVAQVLLVELYPRID
jgi:hypothetical protein